MVRRRRQDDSGATTVEVAVVLPLLLLLLMVVVQVGLWFHVRSVMAAAANKGVDATRVEAGTAADGERAAEEFLDHTAALDDVTIEAERDADQARVEVSGRVVSLLFGAPLHLSVTVDAPVEQVRP